MSDEQIGKFFLYFVIFMACLLIGIGVFYAFGEFFGIMYAVGVVVLSMTVFEPLESLED